MSADHPENSVPLGDGESSQSFWDRYPWRGAAIFFAMLVAVGLILAFTIGERPHYRAVWKLIEDRPDRGSVIPGMPFSKDPVTVEVMVRVEDAKREPVFGKTVVLATDRELTRLAEGKTGKPGGHCALPVPGRFDPVLFSGGLVVLLLESGEAPRIVKVTPPLKGRSTVLIDLADPSIEHLWTAGNITLQDGKAASDVGVRAEMPSDASDTSKPPTATTDDKGSFRIFGPKTTEPFRIVAYATSSALRTEEPIVPGTTGLELRLLPFSEIEGVLRCANPDDSSLEVCLVPRGASPARALRRDRDLLKKSEIRFRFVGVPAGRFDLLVLSGTTELSRVADLDLPAGSKCGDSRLSCVSID